MINVRFSAALPQGGHCIAIPVPKDALAAVPLPADAAVIRAAA